MRILDMHAHAFPDPIAEKAMQALSEGSGGIVPETDGTVADLLRLMDRHGVEAAVVANIATKPSQAANILDWCLQIRSPRVIPFASVHPASPDLDGEVKRVRAAGLPGVKLHPLYQNFAVDDPGVFPLYEAIQDAGLVLLAHAGYDFAFGDCDLAAPRRFRTVVDRFPRLRLVLAHFGGWRLYDEFLECLAGRPVWIDTSFSPGFCTTGQRDAILRRHDPARILFGSDAPWGGLAEQIRYVEDFPVADAAKEGIFYGNAAALLGLD